MIDTKTNKLVFAEASKDFVDFIFFLLALPIGKAINLLKSESMVGSIRNVYKSFSNLPQTYLKSNIEKEVLLDPLVFSSLSTVPLSIDRSSTVYSGKFYTCSRSECKKTLTNMHKSATPCVGCHGSMNQEISFIRGAALGPVLGREMIIEKDAKGYVMENVLYMISDDLSVTPISTMSTIISLMDKLNVSKLEERNVKVGAKEALELLKMSFRSTTVITDVFLKR